MDSSVNLGDNMNSTVENLAESALAVNSSNSVISIDNSVLSWNTITPTYWNSTLHWDEGEIVDEFVKSYLGSVTVTPVKEDNKMAKDLAKQIIAWHKAGHSLYPVDILNMMIDTKLLKEEELKPLIEDFKKNPVEPKLPKTYITE